VSDPLHKAVIEIF